jgi:hypothetical protein
MTNVESHHIKAKQTRAAEERQQSLQMELEAARRELVAKKLTIDSQANRMEKLEHDFKNVEQRMEEMALKKNEGVRRRRLNTYLII